MSRAPLNKALERMRFIAWFLILLILVGQTIFGVAVCGAESLWSVFASLMFVAPAIAFGLTTRAYRAIGAVIGILPFLIWAGEVTCVNPDPSKGPSFAYASALFFGIPTSLVIGFLFGRCMSRRAQANAL